MDDDPGISTDISSNLGHKEQLEARNLQLLDNQTQNFAFLPVVRLFERVNKTDKLLPKITKNKSEEPK